MSRKNFVHSFTRKQGLGKVSLYHLETPTQKFEFTSPLGIKTLYPSSSVDMVRPVYITDIVSIPNYINLVPCYCSFFCMAEKFAKVKSLKRGRFGKKVSGLLIFESKIRHFLFCLKGRLWSWSRWVCILCCWWIWNWTSIGNFWFQFNRMNFFTLFKQAS